MTNTAPLPLNAKAIHVWTIQLPSLSWPDYHPLLKAAELEKAYRFKFEADQHAFIISRGVLKTVLGFYTHQLPEQIALKKNAHGKLFLQPTFQDLQFNLSHSKDLTVIAITKQTSLGIDVEYRNPIKRCDDIVSRYFSKKEQRDYQQLPKNKRLSGFYHAWTQKEAYIKAVGKGLSYPLHHFTVSIDPTQPAQLIDIEDNSDKARCWTLYSFSPQTHYQAAVCWKNDDKTIMHCNYLDLLG
jgi:4'-phosphopantetheinyl transferase